MTENKSSHNVDTLKDLMDAERRTMDERDRRYTENRTCDQDAVKLAKEAADKASGTVSIVGIVAVVSGVVGILSLAVALAALIIPFMARH